MEGLLILAGIYVLEVIVKKVAASKKQQQSKRQDVSDQTAEQDSHEENVQPQPKRSLQDLIRQFEEAQREASQGTYVPPTPSVEDVDQNEDQGGLPVVKPANPGEYTFIEIAESVVQWEYVSVELLQEAFGFSDSVSQQVLEELQAKHVVGRDMGDGDCDLLVHDKTELANLFKRLQREAEEQHAAEAEENAIQARREAELKHQKELAELEERARQLREQASQGSLPPAEAGIAEPCLASGSHQVHSHSFNKEEIRRGFVWAKVIDEPRFKKRWTSRTR